MSLNFQENCSNLHNCGYVWVVAIGWLILSANNFVTVLKYKEERGDLLIILPSLGLLIIGILMVLSLLI